MDEAILDLAIREGSGKGKIGVYNKETDIFIPSNFEMKANIKSWIAETDIDAVIWTNLKSNFKAKSGFDYTEDLALKYLKYLTVNV